MTDTGSYCDFGGLPRSMCAHCRAGGEAWPQVASPAVRVSPVLCPPLQRLPPYRVPDGEITAEQTASYILARYASFPVGVGPYVTNGGPFSPTWFAQLWEAHEQALERGFTVQARWRGKCPGCGDEWDEGDDISWSDDESAWVCRNCITAG